MTARRVKTGKLRKSRRLRLPFSSSRGGDVKFTPQPMDWQRIENAYARSLSTEDRATVVALVEKYFRFQPSEPHAPFADEALHYLDQLEKTGKKFRRELLEPSHTPMTGAGAEAHSAAVRYVQSQVGRHLSDYKGQTDWGGLLDVMQACIPAFIATREYINDQAARSGFVEGGAWRELVWKLTEFAKERNLPSGVSNFDDPQQASRVALGY